DATKSYEAARDGLLRAIGLPLPSVKVTQQSARQDLAQRMTVDDLLSLSAREFENAVALMLTSIGYGIVQRLERDDVPDLLCTPSDGTSTFVWCRRYKPGNLVRQQVVMEALDAVATDGHLPIQAMIVTTSGYTPRALAAAQGHLDQIQLVDGQLVDG